MRILVLGGEGMLGHKMFQALAARFPGTKCTVLGSLRDPFYRSIPLFTEDKAIELVNVMNLDSLRRTVAEAAPQFIVNCVGIVKQRDEAKMAVPSITVNSLLPHLLADWGREWGGRLIHFSTDCVFSGRKGGYAEDDPTDAEDLYGLTKYLGEEAGDQALTLRTSIIGRELMNFRSLLEWFLAQKGKTVKGYRRVIYSGVTTNYLAEQVVQIVTRCPGLSGLYHLTAPAISKYDLLCRLRQAYRLDVEIVPDDGEASDRSLRGERFRAATGFPEPQWDALIAQLAGDETPYGEWLKGRTFV